MSVFDELGIYGMGEIEEVILAGLVSGDPILLVGRHGSAKTLLARRIARALGLKFIAYDASKALFDDVIGFPNPHLLGEGKLDYIPTPISIWDKEFILIDEISRANPSMQNKWLEVIRSRQIMGRKIPNLKYIFAAMNPLDGYLGTTPLDPALAGRFAFILTIPDVTQMKSGDINKVILNICEDDAVVLSRRTFRTANSPDDANQRNLRQLITSAQNVIARIAGKYNRLISNYIMNILGYFLSQKVKLDGRRLGMFRRNCLAYLAIKTVRSGGKQTEKDIFDYFYECLKYSLPYISCGEELPQNLLNTAHLAASKNIDFSNPVQLRAKIFLSTNLLEMIDNYISLYEKVSESEHREVIATIIEKYKKLTSVEDVLEIYFALGKLIKLYRSGVGKCPVDTKRRAAELYLELTSVTDRIKQPVYYESILRRDDEDRTIIEQIDFDDKIKDISFRLLLNCGEGKRNPSIKVDYGDYESLQEKYKKYLCSREVLK